jgi:hypothetical protein
VTVTGADGQVAAFDTRNPPRSLTVPMSGTITWDATVNVPAEQRTVTGRVELGLPWPFGAVTVTSWSETTSETVHSGSESYTLPAGGPPGVLLPVRVVYDDTAARCETTVNVRTAGRPLGSWHALFAAAVTVFTVGLCAAAGRAGRSSHRYAVGMVSGFVAGVWAAATLWLFGAVPFDSIMFAVLPAVFAALSATWVWQAPSHTPGPLPEIEIVHVEYLSGGLNGASETQKSQA